MALVAVFASSARAQELDGGVLDAQLPVVEPAPDAETPAEVVQGAAPLLLEPPPLPSPMLTPVESPSDFSASARIQRPAGPGELELYGTGSKVNAPLREVPHTVNVIDQQQLRERGVLDQQQALELLPGVVPMFTYGGFQQIQMRGFEALNLYDGRRDMRSIIAESAPVVGLFDVDRIEVLRGPSAVLYGFGAVGGVVNQVRRRASRTPLYELEGGLGTPYAWTAHAAAQGPVSSKLAYRVDVGHVTRRDFRGAQTDRNQVTSTFQWKPTARDTFNLRFSVAVDKYTTDVGIPTVLDANNPNRLVLPYGTRYGNRYSSQQDHFDYSRLEAALDYRHDFSQSVYAELRGWIVRDHYSYIAAESLRYVPASGMQRAQVAREYLYFARGWRPLQVSAELHADLRTGPIQHQLVGGYQLESFTGVSDRSNLDGAELQNVDFAYPVDQSPPVSYNLTAKDHYRIATHSLYAYDHIKLLDSLIVTGGIRLDFLKSRTRREFLDRDGAQTPDPTTMAYRRPNLKDDFNTTGSVGLVYTPLELLTTYVSYANSYKPQFVSPSAREVTDYAAERSQQLEGGLRVRVDQNQQQLELDAAGYLIRKRNLLVPKGPDDFQTAGLAQSRGLDLSLRYAVPYVQLMGAYSLIDSAYRKFIGDDPLTGDQVSFKGKTLILAPRHSGNAWARVSFGKLVSAGVGTRVRGRTWADSANRLELPSYALLDASITVGSERASFTLRANNLLDRVDYFSSVINMSQVTPGPGREILGTLRLAL
ncbi:MAG TPA: TonB-dependent receptor [Polyangiales bacterium]|nr:TonB-dependent receptor [Polyangiales bacterium]